MTPHGHESHPLGPPVGNAAAPDPVTTSGVGERGTWDHYLGQLFEPDYGWVQPEDEGYVETGDSDTTRPSEAHVRDGGDSPDSICLHRRLRIVTSCEVCGATLFDERDGE